MAMHHLLIVDDEQSICWGLQVAEQLGYRPRRPHPAEQGLAARASPARHDHARCSVARHGRPRPPCSISQDPPPGVPIVIMTAHGDLSTAVAAVRNGAFDYLTKPFDLAVAATAYRRRAKHARGLSKKPSACRPKHAADPIVGASPPDARGLQADRPGCPFRRLRACLRSKAAPARSWLPEPSIATAAARDGPFVAVNLASLSPRWPRASSSVMSAGAFTGAEQSRQRLAGTGRWRHDLSRRSGRYSHAAASQAAARAGVRRNRAGGRRQGRAQRLSPDLRDAPESASSRWPTASFGTISISA